MTTFASSDRTFTGLSPADIARLASAAADLVLVLDADGVVRDAAFASDGLAAELDDHPAWTGQPLTALVALDSRPKVAALLRDAGEGPSRWRHLNHMAADGRSVPVSYRAAPVGSNGRTIVFGRDLRPMADLQQRLVAVQQSLERDYSRLRDAETRYRQMFHQSAEAALVLDAEKGRVTEANPAAAAFLGGIDAAGLPLARLFDAGSLPAVQAYLAAVRAGGREPDITAKLLPHGRLTVLRGALFRQDNGTLLLLRLAAAAPVGEGDRLLDAASQVPDAIVVTDDSGNILRANAAFLASVQLATEGQAVGEPLDRWVGQTGIDLAVLNTNVRQRGSVRLFSTAVRAEDGSVSEVEISAVAMDGSPAALGYVIRNVGPRVHVAPPPARSVPRSVEQLTELIGRVALKDLVREATEVIEKLSIEAALELTGDNRASAADMLGLSRQSLYVKLRRYGLGDLTGPGPD